VLDLKFDYWSPGGYQVQKFGRQVEILIAIFCVGGGGRAAWGLVWEKLAHMYYYNRLQHCSIIFVYLAFFYLSNKHT
jgi:hypothetical protein